MTAPGELIGEGRAADVYDIGDGRVLRRYRTERDSAPEAAVMQAARAAGVPVPEVFDVDGRDLVMARVDGPTMLGAMLRRPWHLRRHAATLADLHHRVAATPRAAFAHLTDGAGIIPDAVLTHGDLHPDNVILTADGPVIIDWTNARPAAPHVDAALTWLVLSASDPGGGAVVRAFTTRFRSAFVEVFRSAFVEAFRSAYGAEDIDGAAGEALRIKLADPGTSEAEGVAMQAAVHPAGR